jgi:hypothetical protein
MPDQKTTRGRWQDPAQVVGGQDHEVSHQSHTAGASASEVRCAVKYVGNSRAKVEGKLGK